MYFEGMNDFIIFAFDMMDIFSFFTIKSTFLKLPSAVIKMVENYHKSQIELSFHLP